MTVFDQNGNVVTPTPPAANVSPGWHVGFLGLPTRSHRRQECGGAEHPGARKRPRRLSFDLRINGDGLDPLPIRDHSL